MVMSTKNFLAPKNAESIFRKLNDAEVFNVVITGGEPLLNMPASLACIELARSSNMGVNMNSSLTLLTTEKAIALRMAGLKHILTSILGPTPEIHDSITKSQNSFRLLLNGIRVAQDAGISVSANMVVSSLNVEHVRTTAEVVSGLGIKTFNATKAGCPGNCRDFFDLSLSQKQVVRFLNDLCWVRQHLEIEVDTLEPIPLCGLYGVEHPELFTTRRCVAGITTMTVSYDGPVRPCSHLDLSYGNLLQEDFKTIWDRMDLWREGFQIPGECKTCPLFPMCGAGCRMEAKTRTGKINDLDPYSIPHHALEMAKGIKERRAGNVPKTETLTSFRTVKFRLRQESFGGVVALGGNKMVLLDQHGFEIVRQFRSETVYEISDPTIDWRGLKPDQFVVSLVSRGMVSSVKKGGDVT